MKLGDSYPLIAKAALYVAPKGLLQARQKQLEHSKVTVQKRLQNSAGYSRNDFMNSMLQNQDGKNGIE